MRRKPKKTMVLPASVLFSCPVRVEVLRALFDAVEPMTGRETSRAAGVGHQPCALALSSLEKMGVISRTRSGRSAAAALNRNNPLVSRLILPFFRAEEELAREACAEVYGRLEPVAARIEPGDFFCGTRRTVIRVPARSRERARRLALELCAGFEEAQDLRAEFAVRLSG